jgi:hypothetical protein
MGPAALASARLDCYKDKNDDSLWDGPIRRFGITGINKNGRDAPRLSNCLSQLTVACLRHIQWS